MARIFLCHASEDKPQVRKVYERLKALGFEPWLDEEEILPSQDSNYKIETALEGSDFVLVFLSERSVDKTGYVQREFRRALYHLEEMPEDRIHTIPVKLDDCMVPRRFIRHQWTNLNDDGAFDRIVRALKRGLEQRGELIPEPLSANSTSTVSVDLLPPNPSPNDVSSVVEASPLQQTFTNRIGMEFILIHAGEFRMGSPDSDPNARDNEKPAHQVTISQAFYLGKYPVTQAQWKAMMGTSPSEFKGEYQPVESVSWDDAQAFMEKLNEWDDIRSYRLPTEAQWEYACRAGSNTIYHFGDNAARLGEYTWYSENSGDQTHPIGQKKPNDWGLHDMHGNVAEWVQDWEVRYTAEPIADPTDPDSGAYRGFRGGSWDLPALYARSAFRDRSQPGNRGAFLGFRCLSSGSEPGSGAQGKP